MENSDSNIARKKKRAENLRKVRVLSVSELDILRKAYEIILENSDHCFGTPDIPLMVKRESGEYNLVI